MERVIVRLPHGYFKGGVEPLPETSPTIDAHIDCWHVLIGEGNGILLRRDRNKRRVDEKTAEGYSENLADERERGGVS